MQHTLLPRFVLLCTLAAWPVRAVSIQDFLFNPSGGADMLPRIPLDFLGGTPTARFSVGTPPQNFTGIFDTGSPFTWMMSTECTAGGCANVPLSEKFNHTASTTNTPFPIKLEWDYPDGTHIQIEPELDTVVLAETVPFPRHVVGEAFEVTYPAGYVPVANARIGAGGYRDDLLSMSSLKGKGIPSDVSGAEPPTSPGAAGAAGNGIPLRRAAGDDHFSTGRLQSGSGGFRKRAPAGSHGDGIEFAWVLGSDPSMYSGTLYPLELAHDLAADGSPFWKVPLKGVSLTQSHSKEQFFGFADKGGGGSNGIGAVESSIPYLKLPPAMAEAINSALGAKDKDPDTGVYMMPCDARHKAPGLIVHFAEGVDVKIPPEAFINQYEHVPEAHQAQGCFSTIVPGQDDHTVSLGGPFFRNVYLEFGFFEQKIFVAESIAHTAAVYKPADSSKGGDDPSAAGPSSPTAAQQP